MSEWGGSTEPLPGPSEATETAPLNPRFRQYNLGTQGRRTRSQKLLLALLGLITTVGLFLGLVFGLTKSPNQINISEVGGLSAPPGEELLLLTRNRWPILDVSSAGHLLSGVRPLSISKEYLSTVRNSSLLRLSQLDKLETRLKQKGVQPAPHSASHRHQQLFMSTSSRAREHARDGMVNNWAAQIITRDYNLSSPWTERVSQLIPVRTPDICRAPPPSCNASYPYRTANGTCNNLQNPLWGSAFRAFRRVLQPDYEDGVSFPRSADDGGYLPAARQVCRHIFTDEYHGDTTRSLLMMQWGQFIDHDLTATAASKGSGGAPIRCCGPDIDNDPTLLHPECAPLLISFEDPQFAKLNVSCLDFVRSAPAPLCTYGPRQQMNQITSFLDGSNIYGSSDEQLHSLRNHTGGRMAVQTLSDGRRLLPPSKDASDGCNRADAMAGGQYCFVSGDARVNEQISLTITHTQWVRQHNMIAEELADINPHWDDERLFQESRKITVAMMQHITANEYLPLLLGEELAQSASLLPQTEGYFTGYSEQIDPTISNVFATAAFRFGHSQIQGLIKMVGAFSKTEDFIQLHRLYFNPFRLYQDTKMTNLVRGQLNTCSRATDGHLTSQITTHLFEAENATTGLDLGAINVQRGRDHGLPPYNAWRRRCGLPPVTSFEQLRAIVQQPEQVDHVQMLYRSIEHVDLYVGGLLERPLEGAAVGPTFACLLTDQFVRLKAGDRFWYESGDPSIRFTPDQLQEIRKANLARVLCDTSDDIRRVQERPMLLPSEDNKPQPCGSVALPVLDLGYWEEIVDEDDGNDDGSDAGKEAEANNEAGKKRRKSWHRRH
ncbi:peroxidase-like [Amphibalanus amphitrite]|uniref:peroxidase-like n=1 Tax=Amphibalanus amphitrite TaxID=1232801 RepID=UPI001C91C395|nr:peroxidase-like [Amphibalanus amphitrite]